MKKLTHTQEKYWNVAQAFLWAEAMDFTCWFTGEWKRWKRTEYHLPRMVKKGALVTARHGHKLVYTDSRKKSRFKGDIEHGLTCTNALLRFQLSKRGQVVSEKFFRKMDFGAVPEWAVIYKNNTMFFEYSTADNFRRKGLMKGKIENYREAIDSMEKYLGKEGLVLFVFDAPSLEIKRFVNENVEDGYFWFVDKETFLKVRIGDQLTAPIYMNGGDGKIGPLVE